MFCGAERVLLTFDKDFSSLYSTEGFQGSGVVLFRFIPESPDEVAGADMALLPSQPDLRGTFCVITRERIRVRPMRPDP